MAASRLVERCEAAGVTLGIVFQHRFREGSERLRRLLAGVVVAERVRVDATCRGEEGLEG